MAYDKSRLYGLPGAETMHFDIESAYESVADWTDIDEYPASVEIEEWTVGDPIDLLPKPGDAIESITEHYVAGEVIDFVWDDWERASNDPDVLASMKATLELLASKVNLRMAGKQVASHIITFDDEGEPILNGERLYRPVSV